MGDESPRAWVGEVRAETETVLDRLPPRNGCDRVFYVLSASRRRSVLYHLARSPDGVAERHELVAAVRSDEASKTPGSDDPGRDDVERDLECVHLPCLVEAGYVDYDQRHGTVRYDPTPLLESWVARLHELNRGTPL